MIMKRRCTLRDRISVLLRLWAELGKTPPCASSTHHKEASEERGVYGKRSIGRIQNSCRTVENPKTLNKPKP